jgi:hypothetical protein
MDPFIIQQIAQWLPTSYHIARARLVSRAWRDALANIARTSRISPRALLTYGATHGDLTACIDAREKGAQIIASFAGQRANNAHRAAWMEHIWPHVLELSVTHDHLDITRALLTWIDTFNKLCIRYTLQRGAIIGAGAAWRARVPAEYREKLLFIDTDSISVGMSGDIDLIREYIRHVPFAELATTGVIRGLIRAGNLAVFDQVMREFPCTTKRDQIEVMYYLFEGGHVAHLDSMMNRAPFFVRFEDLCSANYMYGTVGKSGSIELCSRILVKPSISYSDLWNMLTDAASCGHDSLCMWIIDNILNISTLQYCTQSAILYAAAADHWSTCLTLRTRFPHCFRDRDIDEVMFGHICRSTPHLASRIFEWLVEDGANIDKLFASHSSCNFVVDGLRARYKAMRAAE